MLSHPPPAQAGCPVVMKRQHPPHVGVHKPAYRASPCLTRGVEWSSAGMETLRHGCLAVVSHSYLPHKFEARTCHCASPCERAPPTQDSIFTKVCGAG